MNENYKDFVTICIFLFQIARSQAAEGRLRRGMDRGEHNKHIDQYAALVLRCTHVEQPSPGPEAGLLTLMMVCSIGVFVFLGQNIVVTGECIRYTVQKFK
jgi:hypothetical protein